MAVQARHLSRDFPTASASACLDEYGGCFPAAAWIGATTALSDFPRSELTCSYGFGPRKRARLAPAEGFWEDQRVALPVPVPQGLCDVQTCAVGSGAASTSGRTGMASGGSVVSQSSQVLLSRLCHQGVEIDALVTLETERLRAGMQEAQRRQTRALLAAAARAGSGRLRAAEAELERALRRNAELEEKARQVGAECRAWMGVASSHEAVAAGHRAALDQLLKSPCAAIADGEGETEDAQSCCFELEVPAATAASRAAAAAACKACGAGEACVLLLPCRHLCLCRSCEAAVGACPVCATAKNASLHVLLS